MSTHTIQHKANGRTVTVSIHVDDEDSRDPGAEAVQSLAADLPVDPDWNSREGYQRHFLGKDANGNLFDVPLPRLSEHLEKDSVVVPKRYRARDGDPYVLPYHHFSVAFNKRRRTAWFSAANIDGDHPIKVVRKNDRWRIDDRIDDPENPIYQMGEELYAKARTDRGHLTRFLDVAWGESDGEAISAVADTFHFTNCTLQLDEFNQGRGRWQGLERFLLEEKARRENRRMCVFTGPVFSAHDPSYRNEFMSYSTKLPLCFWKVCAIERHDGEVAAAGFILGQPDVTELPGVEAEFDIVAAQISIRRLAQLTRLDFGVLTGKDFFDSGEDPLTLDQVPNPGGAFRVRRLRTIADAVI